LRGHRLLKFYIKIDDKDDDFYDDDDDAVEDVARTNYQVV
jgi:hypothetical protein